jgi:DNA repair protein RecN (Recombination protein N)
MLALRLVVGGGAPTMLFDEVDAGVGGAAALALARALADVAAARQVLVVTHLAQVAAFADHQVAVRKAVTDDGRTVTTAEVLSGEERVIELSRMLSGHPDSATARAHAEELLDAGRSARPTPRSGSSRGGRGSTIGRRRSD